MVSAAAAVLWSASTRRWVAATAAESHPTAAANRADGARQSLVDPDCALTAEEMQTAPRRVIVTTDLIMRVLAI